MYESLCGKPPFAEAQGMRILWAHLQDPPPDPRGARPDLSPELARTLLMALEKEAEKRPSTAGEYARMLAAAASDGREGG
jgi:serine/threonine-protein kinase